MDLLSNYEDGDNSESTSLLDRNEVFQLIGSHSKTSLQEEWESFEKMIGSSTDMDIENIPLPVAHPADVLPPGDNIISRISQSDSLLEHEDNSSNSSKNSSRSSSRSKSPSRSRSASSSEDDEDCASVHKTASHTSPTAVPGESKDTKEITRSRSRSGSRHRHSRSRSKEKRHRTSDQNKRRHRSRNSQHDSSSRHRGRHRSRDRTSRRHHSRSRSKDRHRRHGRRRRSGSKSRRNSSPHHQHGHSPQRSKRRSRSPQRRRSRSREKRPHIEIIEARKKPISYKEQLRQQLLKASKILSEQGGDGSMGEAIGTIKEKPSNLPLNSTNVFSNMSSTSATVTPQMALYQTMAAMHQKAQELTGIAVPKYYNPAAVNPLKYAEQVQKRKLLWSKNKDKKEETGQWQSSTYLPDQDGKQTAKFRKLMGIKEDEEDIDKEAKTTETVRKQEELFTRLDKEYEFARMATHTHRGIGLGFQSQGGFMH